MKRSLKIQASFFVAVFLLWMLCIKMLFGLFKYNALGIYGS